MEIFLTVFRQLLQQPIFSSRSEKRSSQTAMATIYILPVLLYFLECEFNLERALQALPLRSQLPIKRLHRLPDRALELSNKLLQAYGLALTSNKTIADVLGGIQYSENGKPSYENLAFNMSNDREFGLVTMAIVPGARSVGLDTIDARIVSQDMIEELSDVMHSAEKEYVHDGKTHQEKVNRFARVWSLKEAYGKYLGTGIVGSDLSIWQFCLEGIGTNLWASELYINGEKQDISIVTKRFNDHVFYTIVSDKLVDLEERVLDLEQVVKAFE